ncbi:hypothetical protein [Rhizobacter sp. LjRoot28]|uniref:hypothetical protein n=1 Tax=Rhizobacter sp. LjRoot28 TaxID=3342309 RepID=UPI003ED16682
MMQFHDAAKTNRSSGKVARPRLLAAATWAGTVLVLSACGGGGGGDAAPAASAQVPVTLGTAGPGDAQNHLPLAVGHSWQFEGTITEGANSSPTSTTVTIPSTRDVGGATALVLRESVVAGGQTTVIEEALVKDANGVAVLAAADDVLSKALVPYWELRFPLTAGAPFVQLDKTGLDFGEDLDGDGRNELVSLYSSVQVVGVESVTVPFGTFPTAVHVRRVLELTVRRSSDGLAFDATETGDAWFAPSVGWVQRKSELVGMGEKLSSLERLTAYTPGSLGSAGASQGATSTTGSTLATEPAWRRVLRASASAR